MPFRSKQQMKACFASDGFGGKIDCKQWAKETGDTKKLPKRVKKQLGGNATVEDLLRRKQESQSQVVSPYIQGIISPNFDQPQKPSFGGYRPNVSLLRPQPNAESPRTPLMMSSAANTSLPINTWEIGKETNALDVKQKIEIDPYFALKGFTNGMSWLSGMVERGRQNQYMMDQLSTLGQTESRPVEDFQPNPYRLYSQFGGSVKKYQKGGATRSDSLAVYNNSLNRLNYYKNKGYEISPTEYDIGFSHRQNEDAKNILEGRVSRNNQPRTNRSTGSRRQDQKFIMDEYYRNLDENHYLQRELQHGILDLRTSAGYFDRRIQPTARTTMNNNIEGDILKGDEVSLFHYDPVLVKPADMKTKEDLEIIRKRYGTTYDKYLPNPSPRTSGKETSTIKNPEAYDKKYPPIEKESPAKIIKGKIVPINTIDTSIPMVSARAPEMRIPEQRPTPYSFTYRDESDPSQQQSVYFKDANEWESFINNNPDFSIEGSEKGSNYATARGYKKMKKGGWIQKATKNMRKDKPCTGSKFGGPSCRPGTRRYALAKTFRKMAKD